MNQESANSEEPQAFFLLMWLKYALWSVFIFFVAVAEFVFGAARSPYRRTRKEKEEFWILVKKWLVEFHGKSPEQTYEMVCDFEKTADRRMSYCHMPFQVANTLAGHDPELPLEEYQRRYLKGILGKQTEDQTNG